MLSSIQTAVGAVSDTDAYLIALGDQPQLDPGVVKSLVRAAERSTNSIFLPTSGGKRGHPLLLSATYREEILALPQTVGMNALVAAHELQVEVVEVGNPEVLEDVDTPEDYARISRNERR